MESETSIPNRLQRLRWAAARLAFTSYIGFSVVTLVGGFLTAPLMTWYFFGDWRFWRYLRSGSRMLPHGLRLLRVMASDRRGFMFSVPLTSPPRSAPNPKLAVRRRDWSHGESCGTCTNCCRAGGYACPLLSSDQGHCQGYNSFYWRYFNCGRFPSVQPELEYYGCRKWALVPIPVVAAAPARSRELLPPAVDSAS